MKKKGYLQGLSRSAYCIKSCTIISSLFLTVVSIKTLSRVAIVRYRNITYDGGIVKGTHTPHTRDIPNPSNIQHYYTSCEDSRFWLMEGHGLIVMISSLLSDRLLSLTAYEIVE